MENKRKKINNHFIQKAFARNFSNKGLLKYTYYKPNSEVVSENTFNVNEIDTSNHPIVKKYFHSQEIEDGMNEIENEGIKVIKKIAYEANNNTDIKIILNRNEIYSLKFYFLLSSIRTNGYRNNISNLSGDYLFNEAVKKDKRGEKVIQENQIQIIIDEYKKYKKKEPLLSAQLFNDPLKIKDDLSLFFKDLTFEQITLIYIQNIINSRLLIFKFKKNKLFLQETIGFNERTSYDGIMYYFMAISPNIGIMFYLDPLITRGLLKLEKSVFFKNDISEKRNNVIYVNEYEMKQEHLKLIKENIYDNSQSQIDELNRFFLSTILSNFFHDDDKYTYDVLEESEEVQDICNAMSLIHNEDRFLSYQNKDDIKDAEIQIKKLNINRIEDSTQ